MDHSKSGADAVLTNLSSYNINTADSLKKSLQQLTLIGDEQRDQFSKQCSKVLRKTFQHLIQTQQQQDYVDTLKSLLENLFYGVLKNRLKLSLVLALLDDMFECLSVKALRSIFEVVEHYVGQLENVDSFDQNTLLRIINSMLKRISKAQDIQFRGRLHIALSKMLKLCHDSGMKGKGVSSGSNVQIDEEKDFPNTIVTYKFYREFWGLQKYFSDPSLLNTEGFDPIIQQQTPSLAKIIAIESILTDIFKVFSNNPVKQQGNRGHQPIKYLSHANLLETQLNDSYFRKLFLTQALLFCFSLKNSAAKNGAKDDEKMVINETEKRVRESLAELSGCLGEDPLCPKLDSLLLNQKQWIDLKQNWKEKKKTLIQPINSDIVQQLAYYVRYQEDDDENKRNLYNQLINPHTQKAAQKQEQILSEMMMKMKTEGLQFMDLLEQNNQHRQLQTIPLMPSFESYFDEAARTLKSLQQRGSFSNVFETKGAYIAYEWKAMRALYRQNLHDALVDKKDTSKLKEYRLLSVVKKKLQEANKATATVAEADSKDESSKKKAQ